MLEGLVITAEISVLRLYIFRQKSKHQPINEVAIAVIAVVVVILAPIVHGLVFFGNVM